MARKERETMSEERKEHHRNAAREYDIKSAKDIEDALKDLLGGRSGNA